MEQKYIRRKNIIKDMHGEVIFKGKSINAAKRESRKLQGTTLGQGLLLVE